MHNLQKLKVYHLARQNLKNIANVIKSCDHYGDLKDQIERSSLSVVSNIAEGSGSTSNANFARFLGYARASNRELYSQLEILNDLGTLVNPVILIHVDQVSAMLFALIKRLQE